MFIWCSDPRRARTIFNKLNVLVNISGMIYTRLVNRVPEPFPAIHYCVGGAWDVFTVGDHLARGTRVKGVVEVFDRDSHIEEMLPSNYDLATDGALEKLYRETK